jgi:hypothetical protein
MKQVVIMPGGFHPFHAGHYALYKQAQDAFPGADVYVAATNDTSTRPFPFALKEKLAKLAGVNPGKFIQVKSPFRAMEIVGNMDPADTQLIFVRSTKDADKPPQAGGIKKDGTPAYLQLLKGQAELAPMAQHAYMAYLPTVEFGPGMTSATEIRTAWPRLNEKRKTALVMSLYPKTQKNPALAANVVKMLDTAIGTEELNEFAPGGDSASSYYAVTANFVNEFTQQKQQELQDLIDAGWTKQDLAQAGTLKGQAADIAHFERVRDGFLKGLKPGFDAYLRGDTQMKDQLGAYWMENDLPLNQDWEKIYGEPWGDDSEFNEDVAEGTRERLSNLHDKIRKEKGLPDPKEYLKMIQQKKKEIADLKAEIEKEKLKKSGLTEDYVDEKKISH